VYNYYRGKGKCTSAVKRAIIEADLIEAFHWTPNQIKEIPYRDLQMFYMIVRQKGETKNQMRALQEYESKNNVGQSRGQVKR
jgi:hypothetical protein